MGAGPILVAIEIQDRKSVDPHQTGSLVHRGGGDRVALHITPKPGKPADQGTMYIEPVTAEPRQTYGVLAPHKADRRNHLPAWPHNRRVAMRAPSAAAASFTQTISSATHSRPAKVPKPQSVPATTRSRSPTTDTASSSRRATSSGCSTKFVVVSRTPGINRICVGSGLMRSASYSC